MDFPVLIEKCRHGDHQAQSEFYRLLAPAILGVCRRYLPDEHEAEDAMIQSMYKALTSLDTLRDGRTVHGWIRRIAVNECLMTLRRKKMDYREDGLEHVTTDEPDAQDKLQAEEVLALLDQLPLGYRTIFNLYAIEGYTHKEIGDLLGISLNTSKSQLIQARKKLTSWITETKLSSSHDHA
ncbi:MAG: sigma-70 family RNA polymerase sigma factor [Saprospiraceae bacterium]